jgi:hypothetical protein
MKMDKAKVLAKIIVYHRMLQDREDTDPAFLSNDIKEIRHRIMYTHLRVEQTLQIIIANNIFRLEFKKKNAPTIVENFERIAPIFDNMEFYAKVKSIQALNLLPKKIIYLVSKVNDYRKYFSHPATYQNTIKEYKKPEIQLGILKDLVKILSELDKYIVDNKLFLVD